MEHLYINEIIINEEVKHMQAKVEINHYDQFLLCHTIFKHRILQTRQNASANLKGLTYCL